MTQAPARTAEAGDERLPLAETACRILKRRILDNDLPPGTIMLELEVANLLNMSRTPAREARGNFGGDLGEAEAHRFCVARRQDETGALALLRADGPEDVGRGGALGRDPHLAQRRVIPGSSPGTSLVLLADARLVGKPDLYPRQGNAFVPRNLVEPCGNFS